mmetsp:Transcript_16147/g.40490  ORF Transcript_16147/g.40490 Transcript_16147/m.40490 type:complete len:206 (+) Transcript_16147:4307-4924(+)
MAPSCAAGMGMACGCCCCCCVLIGVGVGVAAAARAPFMSIRFDGAKVWLRPGANSWAGFVMFIMGANMPIVSGLDASILLVWWRFCRCCIVAAFCCIMAAFCCKMADCRCCVVAVALLGSTAGAELTATGGVLYEVGTPAADARTYWFRAAAGFCNFVFALSEAAVAEAATAAAAAAALLLWIKLLTVLLPFVLPVIVPGATAIV